MNDNCLQFHDVSRRRDPTGTTSLRKRFEGDMTRRFRRLKGLITASLVKNDALGLGKFKVEDSIVKIMRDEALEPGQFAFTRSSQKVSGFMEWLKQQQSEGVLDVLPGTPLQNAAENAWTNTYVEASYQKGIRDAGQKLRQAGAQVAPAWIEQAFTRPIHADRIGLIYTRTFAALQGITDEMDRQISRVLANGIANGDNPLKIARDLNNRVDKIGITRARVVARTEVISAHAEATLNGFQEAGVEGVEVEAEFNTAGDDKVCPKCEALDGKVYPMDEARGIIPVHPNCRCAFLPLVKNGTGIELQ